jgi:hypothetical protein
MSAGAFVWYRYTALGNDIPKCQGACVTVARQGSSTTWNYDNLKHDRDKQITNFNPMMANSRLRCAGNWAAESRQSCAGRRQQHRADECRGVDAC